MRRFENLLALFLGMLLAACVVAWYLTGNGSPARQAATKLAASGPSSPMNQKLLQTARRLASVADTGDEQALASEALRLSDHELDEAFAGAVREAAAPGPPPAGPLKQIVDHIGELKARMAKEQDRIAKWTTEAASKDAAASQLELAKARLALMQDELEDAQQDLDRQGGDEHAKLQRAVQEHEAAQRQTAPPKAATLRATATLSDQAAWWFSLGERQRQLDAARLEAAANANKLSRDHDELEKLLNNKPAAGAASASGSQDASAADADTDTDDEEDPTALLARLRGLSDRRKSLAEFDRRIQDSRQLADVYQRWSAVLETRRREVLHLLLRSLGAILAILLAVVLIDRGIRHAFGRQPDRKRLDHWRAAASIVIQLAAAAIILLILFGPPSQISTIIGLATAGLTVALKDFVMAFFGWFVLMGRNGVRVGDWVEINGVGGEVIEIGILKTVVLEMGNWTSAGHPTGRRVSFMNGYAIEGHYFNFSTEGQWLWDEVHVTLPAAGDPYQTAERIRQTVERETEADASAAEQDWERVTRQYGTREFSAKPALDLRPSPTGLEVIVRYITHAPQRFATKSRLFEAIVALLHKS